MAPTAASRALLARRGFAVVGFAPAYYGPGKDRLLTERPPAGAPDEAR